MKILKSCRTKLLKSLRNSSFNLDIFFTKDSGISNNFYLFNKKIHFVIRPHIPRMHNTEMNSYQNLPSNFLYSVFIPKLTDTCIKFLHIIPLSWLCKDT